MAILNEDKEGVVPKVSGVPGKRTLKNLLSTAMMPIGCVLYIYGGGWNLEDTGASELTKSIGISSSWLRFFNEQDTSYTYRNDEDKENSYYPYSGENTYSDAGLDCSGYIGWALYNMLYDENGKDGLVMSSTKIAKTLAEYGWGSWTQQIEKSTVGKSRTLRTGDIVSKNGHVWLCIGTCQDGSVVIAHSTPSDSRDGRPGGGVQLSALGVSKACEAYVLADYYMKHYFPEWYARYEVVLKDYEDYTRFEGEFMGRFSWSLSDKNGILSDPDGICEMTASEVLEILFEA